jgi:hypothetical protein
MLKPPQTKNQNKQKKTRETKASKTNWYNQKQREYRLQSLTPQRQQLLRQRRLSTQRTLGLIPTPLPDAAPTKHVPTSRRRRILHILKAQGTLPYHITRQITRRLFIIQIEPDSMMFLLPLRLRPLLLFPLKRRRNMEISLRRQLCQQEHAEDFIPLPRLVRRQPFGKNVSQPPEPLCHGVVRAAKVEDAQVHGEQVCGGREGVQVREEVRLEISEHARFCPGARGEGAPQLCPELWQRLG